MILYDNRDYVHIIFRLSGSVIVTRPVIVPTAVSSIICVVCFQFPEPARLPEHMEWPAWVFSTALAFAIIFRTALAYRRFWQGVAASVSMISKWRSAFSDVNAFITASLQEHRRVGNNEVVEELNRSKLLIMHWFSVLFALAVQTLQWREEAHEIRPMTDEEKAAVSPAPSFWSFLQEEEKFDQIYVGEPTTGPEYGQLAASFDKLTEIIQWIEHEVAHLHIFKRILIESPILTRVFEDLSGGALMYCEAHMISFIPFPFLFAQVVSWLLYIFIIMCPFIVQAAAKESEGGLIMEPPGASWPSLVFMNVLLVSGFTSLNEIAIELEDPFREKLNNFPIRALQRRVDWSIDDLIVAEENDPPNDFGTKNFGEELDNRALHSEDRAIRAALGSGGKTFTGAQSSPLHAVVNVCEELRLTLTGFVSELALYGDNLRHDLMRLEMESCRLVGRVLQAQGDRPVASGPGRPTSSPRAHQQQALAIPSTTVDSVPSFSVSATLRSTDSGENGLRELLEHAANVDDRMGTLLIWYMCFGKVRTPRDFEFEPASFLRLVS